MTCWINFGTGSDFIFIRIAKWVKWLHWQRTFRFWMSINWQPSVDHRAVLFSKICQNAHDKLSIVWFCSRIKFISTELFIWVIKFGLSIVKEITFVNTWYRSSSSNRPLSEWKTEKIKRFCWRMTWESSAMYVEFSNCSFELIDDVWFVLESKRQSNQSSPPPPSNQFYTESKTDNRLWSIDCWLINNWKKEIFLTNIFITSFGLKILRIHIQWC